MFVWVVLALAAEEANNVDPPDEIAATAELEEPTSKEDWGEDGDEAARAVANGDEAATAVAKVEVPAIESRELGVVVPRRSEETAGP